MITILLLFFKINSFYIDSSYWEAFDNNKLQIIISNAYPIENAYGLKDNIVCAAYFSENSLEPGEDFCADHTNIPKWVALLVHAFENWKNIEGADIDFDYFFIPYGPNAASFCILDEQSDFTPNSICWSGSTGQITSDSTFESLRSGKYYKTRLLTLNIDYDLDISAPYNELNERAIKFCHIDDDTFLNEPEQSFCYDFLSFMNRAVGEFLGFRRSFDKDSVMYYQIPQNTKNNTNTPYRVLKEVDKAAARCLYPIDKTKSLKNESCCYNSKHFQRPPSLCDTRLNSESRYTLDVGDAGGTCAFINDNNSNSSNNIKYYMIYGIFLIFVLIFRLKLKKHFFLIFFFYSFNLFASFEYDLGFDDIDYKAIKESLKIDETKIDQKQFINTQDILDQERIKKQELEEQSKTVEVKKVETLVQNLDEQLQYKKFRELKPFFANINFGFTYSTVSDFKKLNQDYKNSDFTGFNDFNITYTTMLEFGIENLLFKNFAPYIGIGYQFNTKDTGTGDLYDGYELTETDYSNSFYAIPIKLGAKYNFYKTESIRSGLNISGGLWISSSSISLDKRYLSELKMSGFGYTTNALIYMDFLVIDKIFFTFNLGYEYSKCNKVVIESSSGDFETQYPKNSILNIKDELSGESRPFKYYISGVHLGAGIKGLF